jgi:NAD(P)-dependent dehydrogenase (short-subunit alcohol dehydrogenase family)
VAQGLHPSGYGGDHEITRLVHHWGLPRVRPRDCTRCIESRRRCCCSREKSSSCRKLFGPNEKVLPVQLDVTDERQGSSGSQFRPRPLRSYRRACQQCGRGLLGAVEEASADDVRAVFSVNVEGLLNVTRSVLPSMRARKSGRIVNISSVGGFVAAPGWGESMPRQNSL